MIEFTAQELNTILDWGACAEEKAAKAKSYMPERYEKTKALWNKVFQAYSEAAEREYR